MVEESDVSCGDNESNLVQEFSFKGKSKAAADAG